MEVVWFSGRGSWRTDIRGASLAKCLVLVAAGARSYCGSSEAEYLNTCSSLFLNGSTVLPEKNPNLENIDVNQMIFQGFIKV